MRIRYSLWACWSICLVFFCTALYAESSPAKPESFTSPHFKAWFRDTVSVQYIEEGLTYTPMLTILAGWDFEAKCWKRNEFANQMLHQLIGGAITRLSNRMTTLLVAVCIEIQQYVMNDDQQLKLPDRLRDVGFYLVL